VEDSLAQIGTLRLNTKVGPEELHNLLAVEAVLGGEGQQLDLVGTSPVTPGVSWNRKAVDLDPKAP
jgi:hypothetical protein